MLKITQAVGGKELATLRLEGRVVGPWVAEVRKACEKILGEGQAIELDLAEVSYVDQHGQALFSHLKSRGITLIGCSPFITEQLKSRAER